MTFPSTLPLARTPDSKDAPILRWGILGTGWIAREFIQSVKAHSNQIIAAVGSRSQQTANQFAASMEIEVAHGGYEDLVADSSLDVIYIATPHNLHYDHAIMALNAGKNVLIEKPLALNAAQAEHMISVAKTNNLFFCEALWTYFLPKFDVIRQIVDAGILGEIKSIYTDYGEFFTRDHRIFNAALAGGPLMDLGTYPVALITDLLGVPEEVAGFAQFDPSGVHGQLSVAMKHASESQSSLTTTLYGDTPTNAFILGTKATIYFDTAFNLPGGFTLRSADGQHSLKYEEPKGGHFEGLHYEAAAVARAIAGGEKESLVRPLQSSLDMMKTHDKIRACTQIDYIAAGLVE